MQVNVFMGQSSPAGASTLTFILSVWAAIGPLIGIFVGAYLTRSFQRRQWIADERVKEWRELLGTLTTSLTTIVQCKGEKTAEMSKDDLRAKVAANEVLSNRLFIAEEVRRLAMLDKWHDAVNKFDKNNDVKEFGDMFGGNIRFHIESEARKDINKV